MAGKDAAEKDGDAEAKGGGKLKLIIMVLPVVLLAAGAGWYFFLKPSEDTGPVTLPAPTPGAVVDVEPITINLAGGHFLQLGISLQPIAGAHEAPTGAKALDLAIDQFSGKSMEELSTKAGREKNKKELIARVKLAYLPHEAHVAAEEEAAKEAGSEEKGAEEGSEESSDEEPAAGEEDSESVPHEEELTGEAAIKAAAELQFQPDVYDVYFTQFVMK